VPDLLEIVVLHQDGSVVAALRGELDLAGHDLVETELRPLSSRYDASQVTLDCRDLTFVDSAGVLELVRLTRTFGDGDQITLRNVDDRVKRVLDLTGATMLFTFEQVPEPA
jgi:anti-anti-sigma factor